MDGRQAGNQLGAKWLRSRRPFQVKNCSQSQLLASFASQALSSFELRFILHICGV